MNCLEFRRRLGSDPASRDPAVLAHREDCPSCAAAHARAVGFEAELARAIDVAVPEGLAARILLAQTTAERVAAPSAHRRHGLRRFALSFAAAAALAVVVVGIQRDGERGTPLGRLVIEHVRHHEPHATEARGEIAGDDIRAAFTSRGVDLPNVPPGISYVHECPVGPYRTVHMVMPEGEGAVSVVYVADPDRPRRDAVDEAGLHAREVPIGAGALVMVGADARGFDRIEQVWREAFASAPAERPLANGVPAKPTRLETFAAP